MTSAERIKGFLTPGAGVPGGNTPWAARYGAELRRVIRAAAERAPRSQQTYLGPSEIGAECDRQVVGKMVQGMLAEARFNGAFNKPTVEHQVARTNHVVDPWPSVVGTAVHAWLADAFAAENLLLPAVRWLTEQRVTPDPRHPGTADLYDGLWRQVNDWKILGVTSMAKVRKEPSRRYQIQLGLYGRGYEDLGLPVDGVNLVACPRGAASIDGLYVWHRDLDAKFRGEIQAVLDDTDRRHALARDVFEGRRSLKSVEPTPEDSECYFCPFYRPDAESSGVGCPGTVGATGGDW